MGYAGNLFGDLFGGTRKPVVPPWKDINLATEQGKAISANEAALPGAEALVSASNAFSQDQITKMLEQAIPGYSSIVGSVSGNIESMLKGEIPTDVSNAVQTSSAVRALEGGYGGSGASRNLVARDLGLTSLDLTGKGISSAETWFQNMNNLFRPSMIDISSMFVTPQQMFADTFQNQEAAWNVKWLQNQIAAQPDPILYDAGQLFGGIADTAASVAVGMLGGGMGGGASTSPSPESSNGIMGANYKWGGSNTIQSGGG